ncbi:hypothetical protein CHELA1G11_11344 [Hyphomicrobiales bacterium]|nr:hypothetical protein CHELA1G11_11344 [Hyphomicrobiales bacterium]CAH1668423.1 hypothetical protein CHELA1G2_12965 [Hyphomicrobiales bacterium]
MALELALVALVLNVARPAESCGLSKPGAVGVRFCLALSTKLGFARLPQIDDVRHNSPVPRWPDFCSRLTLFSGRHHIASYGFLEAAP